MPSLTFILTTYKHWLWGTKKKYSTEFLILQGTRSHGNITVGVDGV